MIPADVPRASGGPRNRVYEAGSRSDPFGILVAEHALLRQQIARVFAAVEDGADGASVHETLGSLSESLEIHQRREDLVLYPLCERLFGGKDGAASVLRDDHAVIVEQLGALLRESRLNGRVSRVRLDALHVEVDSHFGKEEHVLFPLTAALLSGTESSALARRLRNSALR